MIEGARYTHTNLIARDWRKLAAFYESLFGCTVVPPERDYSGSEIESATGIPGSAIAGVHLRLPGHGADGPTLEMYSFSPPSDARPPAVNGPGLAHLAFEVASVTDAFRQVRDAGGTPLGDVVTLMTTAGRRVTFCYITDPEGNVLELQSWDQ